MKKKKTQKEVMADKIIRQHGPESREALWFTREMENGATFERLELLFKLFMG